MSAIQLRNCLCSSTLLDEIGIQDPFHSINFLQPLFYRVLSVSTSYDLSSICFQTYAILQRDSCLLLSIYRLTIFGYFFSCTVIYKLNVNLTTVCFVYQCSTHKCGQAITTAANCSVSLWPTPPYRSVPSCLLSRGSPYVDSYVLQPRAPNG